MAEVEGGVADTGIPEQSKREDELRTKWAMAAPGHLPDVA